MSRRKRSRRQLIHQKAPKKLKHKVVSLDGDPCPRCGRQTEVREHIVLTPKQLAQPFYYSRWFCCTHNDCGTSLVMPPRFRVYPEQREEWA